MSKRTKALAIPQVVKRKVWERDNHCSIWSGAPVDVSCSCCHYIPRTKSGLGIEQNIITLTPEEHRAFDNGPNEVRDKMREYIGNYLMTCYAEWGWSKEKLIYKKFKGDTQ